MWKILSSLLLALLLKHISHMQCDKTVSAECTKHNSQTNVFTTLTNEIKGPGENTWKNTVYEKRH